MITLKKGTTIYLVGRTASGREVEYPIISEYDAEYDDKEIYQINRGMVYYYTKPYPVYEGIEIHSINWNNFDFLKNIKRRWNK